MDDLLSPVWSLRFSPIVALVCLLLAESFFRKGFFHGICLGLATGMLVGAVSLAFQITGFTLRVPERSEVDDLSVTR